MARCLRNLLVFMALLVIGSAGMNCVRQYNVALARNQATISKMGNATEACYSKNQGWKDVFYGALGFEVERRKYFFFLLA